MMPSVVFIFLLVSVQLVSAAEEYKSQTTYPESAPTTTTTPAPPPPPPPPKPAPYVEQSAAPPPPAPYPQQAVPAPAPPPTSAPYPAPTQAPYPAPTQAPYPAPTQAPYPAPTQAPYPQHAVPAPAPAQYPPPPVHYPAPQTVYIQQSAPPPPPGPHPAPHPAYIEHSAPRPAYIEHSAPQPQYPPQPYPQHAPQYPPQPPQHAYNAGPRQFQYVDYPPATTHRPYPYPSFEVLPHHEEYHASSTRRPTTAFKTTTQKPRPVQWGDTEYNYPERALPLKGCFYNNHGYACCNLRLQTKMEELADELLNNGTFHRCNVQKLANDLQVKVETAFKEDFETVVGLSDFAERIHFREHYVCKIEVNGRYMLAWATPDDHSGPRSKRGANSTSDDIHEYNF
ncbi:CBN-GRD-7 protein [Caenorhabditis brenneri]|uniref:CBN-GRD-7 protein n=1 Tax=Caenorhabditis brenneri TaxID=135651 RepID=G0N504_CAEBE|nr:CBN-GRD-7 protein [Caenorhabditis brenneri]